MKSFRVGAGACSLLLLFLSALGAPPSDKTCATCHAEIYKKYSATPMAKTSGPAAPDRLPEGEFSGNAGYQYRISDRGQKLYLDFHKSNSRDIRQRELKYFAGSGANAQSYLIEVDGFLYEAPATWYTRTGTWSFSPGYDRYLDPFLTRAIAPACLGCHATGVQPLTGTQNGYKNPPFLEAGVGCERCHGPGAKHAATGNPSDILNPAKLPNQKRGSICAQCHLSGEIRVDRAGKSMADFTPGENLSDYAIAFVRDTATPGMKVTSHVENLAQSACSRMSGGRLWCGTCHNPHSVPAPAEKAAYFRAKCQTCHAPSVCGRGENCIECHMPGSSVTDADHVVYTDHSIPRRPLPRNRKPPSDAALKPFGGAPASTRDLGLAYAIIALREHNATYSTRAFDLLREAQTSNPDEPQTLAYLADLYTTRRDDANAARLYEKLYSIDPTQSAAPAHLGGYQMQQGHYEQAIRLFEEALKISPALTLVRLDLAVALLHTGRNAEAKSNLEKALEFNPYFTPARELLNRIDHP